MKKKGKNKNLKLSRETIRYLSGKELIKVAGRTCWSATTDCDPPLCQDNQASGGC